MTSIVAHRGASGIALENSPASIKAALALPVDAIEIDVRRTKDGELVLMHDPDTERVADGELWVEEVSIDELKKLKLKNGQSIPTLNEVFKLVGDKKTLVLDIKSPGVAFGILRLLKAHPKVKVFFSGRQYEELEKLHEARPDIPFFVQHHYDPMEIIHRATGMGAAGICLNMWLMNPATYHLALRQGLKVYVYSIDHRWLLKFFQKLYPEANIISHHPERLL